MLDGALHAFAPTKCDAFATDSASGTPLTASGDKDGGEHVARAGALPAKRRFAR